jgi:hypothetical protein
MMFAIFPPKSELFPLLLPASSGPNPPPLSLSLSSDLLHHRYMAPISSCLWGGNRYASPSHGTISATQLMIKKGGNEEEHDDHRGHDRYYCYYGSIFSPVRDDCTADAEKTANIFFVGTGCRQGHDIRLGTPRMLLHIHCIPCGWCCRLFLCLRALDHIVDSLYFTTVGMLSSVGYGDISPPTTPAGKIFMALFALSGTVLLGMVLDVWWGAVSWKINWQTHKGWRRLNPHLQ